MAGEKNPKKDLLEMGGEFCRDVSILIFVFGNLDVWFKVFTGEFAKMSLTDWAITKHVLWVFFVAVAFGITGMLFERWREE